MPNGILTPYLQVPVNVPTAEQQKEKRENQIKRLKEVNQRRREEKVEPQKLHAWINNHMPSKTWDEITYPFPNFNCFHLI